MIDVEDVSIAFGDVDVLRDVSLSVESGSLVGLVGPNGAGKTTLLRTISTVLTPDVGRVRVDGTDVHRLSSKHSSRLIAVVPQDTSVSFAFDVREIVEMGRTPHRGRFAGPTRADRDAVDDALARTATASLANRSIESVSGGERQRVLLARAIAQDAPVMLLDEPTASLDINHQIETMDLVRDLVDDGRTAIAAIHDLDLAARYCDRLVLLADGAVVAEGPPADVLTADRLAGTFQARTAITNDEVTGSVSITPLSPRRGTIDAAVHVLGDGPTAAAVLRRLDAAGATPSLGPVSTTSIAATVAKHLDVEAITVEPYAPIEGEVVDQLRDRVVDADVTVLADLEIGAGNQLLLDALVAETTVLVEKRPLAERNFAGSAAASAYETIRDEAVTTSVSDVEAAIERATVEHRRDEAIESPSDDARSPTEQHGTNEMGD